MHLRRSWSRLLWGCFSVRHDYQTKGSAATGQEAGSIFERRQLSGPCACRIKPAGAFNTHWSHGLYDETHGRAVEVEGVFRIWLEHPPSGSKAQSEANRVEWYKHSNPDHVLEIHPITRVASIDFTPYISEIVAPFEGKKVGFNHWDLTARVTATATALTDGHRLLDILDANGQVVSGASLFPQVTVTGTQAVFESTPCVDPPCK